MTPYGKTYGPFKRDSKTHKVLPGRWSQPLFEYLQDAKFLFTEKLHGTNMRLIYHPPCAGAVDSMPRLGLKGRSDRAAVHGTLKEWAGNLDVEPFVKAFGDNPICIYGEGVGAGIQKGGPQYGDTHFRAFAIKTEHGFFPHFITDQILRQGLKLPTAPVILEATLNDGIEYMKKGFKTQIGPEPGVHYAEGLIGVPTVPLYFNNQGSRVIVKLKHCDLFEGDENE